MILATIYTILVLLIGFNQSIGTIEQLNLNDDGNPLNRCCKKLGFRLK